MHIQPSFPDSYSVLDVPCWGFADTPTVVDHQIPGRHANLHRADQMAFLGVKHKALGHLAVQDAYRNLKEVDKCLHSDAPVAGGTG